MGKESKKKTVLYYDKKEGSAEGQLAFFELDKLLEKGVVETAGTAGAKEPVRDRIDISRDYQVEVPLQGTVSAEDFLARSYSCNVQKLGFGSGKLQPSFIEGSDHKDIAEALGVVTSSRPRSSWVKELSEQIVTFYPQAYRIGSDLPNAGRGSALVSVAGGTMGFSMIQSALRMREFSPGESGTQIVDFVVTTQEHDVIAQRRDCEGIDVNGKENTRDPKNRNISEPSDACNFEEPTNDPYQEIQKKERRRLSSLDLFGHANWVQLQEEKQDLWRALQQRVKRVRRALVRGWRTGAFAFEFDENEYSAKRHVLVGVRPFGKEFRQFGAVGGREQPLKVLKRLTEAVRQSKEYIDVNKKHPDYSKMTEEEKEVMHDAKKEEYELAREGYEAAKKLHDGVKIEYEAAQKEFKAAQKEFKAAQKEFKAAKKEVKAAEKEVKTAEVEYEAAEKEFERKNEVYVQQYEEWGAENDYMWSGKKQAMETAKTSREKKSSLLDDKKKLLQDKKKLLDGEQKPVVKTKNLLDKKAKSMDEKKNLRNERKNLMDDKFKILQDVLEFQNFAQAEKNLQGIEKDTLEWVKKGALPTLVRTVQLSQIGDHDLSGESQLEQEEEQEQQQQVDRWVQPEHRPEMKNDYAWEGRESAASEWPEKCSKIQR